MEPCGSTDEKDDFVQEGRGIMSLLENPGGHMGHIEGHFRDLFSVLISRKTLREKGFKCPMCPPPVLSITIQSVRYPGTPLLLLI